MKTHILHIIGAMNRGGVETWLMHVLRHIDRSQFQVDFLVHTGQPAAYDQEIRSLGSAIIPCPYHNHPLAYASAFKQIIREHGPIHIIHSHVHHYSGYVMRLAFQAGVPGRLAHAHTDTSAGDRQASLPRRWYMQLMRSWIHRYATGGLAASQQAAAVLLGADWKNDPRFRVLYYSIDFTPFQGPVDRGAVRAEFGIPADAFVVGHVGRFSPMKNHALLLDIAAEMAQREPAARLLLVGDGPLRPQNEQQARERGLDDVVIFAGLRSDVPRLLQGAVDAFVMPSFYEGLPVTVIEAQAAGLPYLLSDTITDEVDVVNELALGRLSPSQPASVWFDQLLRVKDAAPGIDQAGVLAIMKESAFNITSSVRELERIYAAAHQPD
jgi:glycosyltransferase involved in cell wall biosynthesis